MMATTRNTKPRDLCIILTTRNLDELRWRLERRNTDDSTPLESIGAWLWSHADGSDHERDDMLRGIGLDHAIDPSGRKMIRAAAAQPPGQEG